MHLDSNVWKRHLFVETIRLYQDLRRTEHLRNMMVRFTSKWMQAMDGIRIVLLSNNYTRNYSNYTRKHSIVTWRLIRKSAFQYHFPNRLKTNNIRIILYWWNQRVRSQQSKSSTQHAVPIMPRILYVATFYIYIYILSRRISATVSWCIAIRVCIAVAQ